MIDAIVKLLPALARYSRQIVPPVIATLIAAVLIQGYNRAFSGQLKQPRMAAMQVDVQDAPAITTVPMTKPPAPPATEYITIYERAEPDRIADKDDSREAVKDATPIRLAAIPAAPGAPAVPVAAPARSTALAPAAKPVRAPHTPPHTGSVAAMAPLAAPPPATASAAAAPVLSAEPPPVILAAPPQAYGMAPQNPQEPPVIETPPPPRGALGAIANALSPTALFTRAREFGQQIERTGNDLLPNIRQ